MTTQQDIREMLEEAQDHESRAESFYWEAKSSQYHEERDYLYSKEHNAAHAARYLRAKAWALVQANPSLKPPDMDVPEVHMLEPDLVLHAGRGADGLPPHRFSWDDPFKTAMQKLLQRHG
jgi:hypothetical protein